MTAAIMLLIVLSAPVSADDLNPPDYRGLPLSVFVHWAGTGGSLHEPIWNWVDDNDPSTYIEPGFVPSLTIVPDPYGYSLEIPNIVDELPLKKLRIQLTWQGTTQPPISISAEGFDGGVIVPGIVTGITNPLVFTQPDGGYQYFDIEFRPNPDFEILHVNLPQNAKLVQVVVDSISTVPEPATVGLLALGSVVTMRRRLKK